MKQLVQFKPQFSPSNKTLDFSAFPLFNIQNLYAVINVTQNTPIFIPGASGYGVSSISGSVITLQYNTSTHSSSDILNVYYDTQYNNIANNPVELGGQLQSIKEYLGHILTELQVMNTILSEGFSRTVNINIDELQQLRNDINSLNNSSNTIP